MFKKILMFSVFMIISPVFVSADENRTDFDIDDDGLIEINNLADLNEIRNHLTGDGLYGAFTGCPDVGCNGFELIKDLDFDTNGDGIISDLDDYWNEGYGWIPLGKKNGAKFEGVFNGNGFEIKNLYMNYSSIDIGFFGDVENSEIKNIGIVGELVSVKGSDEVGILIGRATSSQISNSYSHGSVKGDSFVGGLIGEINNSSIKNSYSTATVEASDYSAGLVAAAYNSQIIATFSSGFINVSSRASSPLVYALRGGSTVEGSFSSSVLISASSNEHTSIGMVGIGSEGVSNSYWAVDLTGTNDLSVGDEVRSYLPIESNILKCATYSNFFSTENICGVSIDHEVFVDWDLLKLINEDGEYIESWDFGSDNEFPGLVMNGVVHRDGDGDGSIDAYDDAPSNWYVSEDEDLDGYPSSWNIFCDNNCIVLSGLRLDQFPSEAAAHLDLDLDGLADEWNESCNQSCLAETNIQIDVHLQDHDNDGLLDSEDQDDNNDLIMDVDRDSDGLIEIRNLRELNAIRFNLSGEGLQLDADADLDSSGCPIHYTVGEFVRKCYGYELVDDLNFDTNNDGIIDNGDEYWNENELGVGEGWLPIGFEGGPFTGTFQGNGFSINNLHINRPNNDNIGLFSIIENSYIKELVLSGSNTQLTGNYNVGLIAGRSNGSGEIDGVFLSGNVFGISNVGAVFGRTFSKQALSNIFSSANVTGNSNIGGVIGNSENAGLNNVLVVGSVHGVSKTDGLIGWKTTLIAIDAYRVENSFWSNDTTILSGSGSITSNFYGIDFLKLQYYNQLGVSLEVESSTRSNSDITIQLYDDWPDNINTPVYWDFGDHHELPGLVLNGKLFRDSDADGMLDANDENPFDYDNDGINDFYDAFPFVEIGQYIDNDHDGSPKICDLECELIGLQEDPDDDIPYVNPLTNITTTSEDTGADTGAGSGSLYYLYFLILILLNRRSLFNIRTLTL